MSKPLTVVCVGKTLIWNEKEIGERLKRDKAKLKSKLSKEGGRT